MDFEHVQKINTMVNRPITSLVVWCLAFSLSHGQFNYTVTVTQVNFSGDFAPGNSSEDYVATFNGSAALCAQASGNNSATWTGSILLEEGIIAPNNTTIAITWDFFENHNGSDTDCNNDGDDADICSGSTNLLLSDFPEGTTNTVIVCSGSNDFTVTLFKQSVGILPVQLLSFDVTASESGADLFWITLSEEATEWHIIERRLPGELSWQEIGRLPALGNSYTQTSYRWTDLYAFETAYYRLTFLDLDGSNSYSATEVVNRGAMRSRTRVYPNPFDDRLFIRRLDGPVQSYEIVSSMGSVIRSGKNRLAEDRLELDLSDLSPGFYSIRLHTADQVVTRQILKR